MHVSLFDGCVGDMLCYDIMCVYIIFHLLFDDINRICMWKKSGISIEQNNLEQIVDKRKNDFDGEWRMSDSVDWCVC